MQQKIFNFRINIYIVIVAVIVLLIFFHYLGLLKPVENALTYITRPMERIIYRSGLNFFGSEKYLSLAELENENTQLKDKLSDALIENARLHSLITKSEVLQKELAFLEQEGYQAKTAQIIGKIPNSTAQIFLLDRGKKDKVQLGLPVIFLDGILVGKIVKVKDLTSQLLLINDSNSTVAAQVQNETSSPGVVVGKLGLSLEMQLIPQAEEIREEQTVITSGLEEKIPAGLVIGQISKVHKQTEELFQTADIKSPISLDRLNVVSIIIP